MMIETTIKSQRKRENCFTQFLFLKYFFVFENVEGKVVKMQKKNSLCNLMVEKLNFRKKMYFAVDDSIEILVFESATVK